MLSNLTSLGAPLTYFTDDGGGGGGLMDFFGSGILAKRDFFQSIEDSGIFVWILFFSSTLPDQQ